MAEGTVASNCAAGIVAPFHVAVDAVSLIGGTPQPGMREGLVRGMAGYTLRLIVADRTAQFTVLSRQAEGVTGPTTRNGNSRGWHRCRNLLNCSFFRLILTAARQNKKQDKQDPWQRRSNRHSRDIYKQFCRKNILKKPRLLIIRKGWQKLLENGDAQPSFPWRNSGGLL